MSFQQHVQEHRRLVTLRLLSEANGYDLNSVMLLDGLALYGIRPSRDQLHSDLAWLEEQGLVTNRTVGSVVVAKLTTRGSDVASGRAHVPGVKRPGPGE